MKHVAVIGAGELGVALSKVLAHNTEVSLWDIDPSKIPGMKPLKETVANADVIFCAVPSFAVREAVTAFKPHITIRAVMVVSLAKGIEKNTEKFMDKVLSGLLPGQCTGVMGGPMLAAELGDGEECIGAMGFSHPETVRESADGIEEIFSGTNLRIEISDDPHGIAIAGVLKNIYAVLMGIAAGFKLGEDETAWLAARAMEEMAGIGTHLGAREETITGTAGFADFLATAYSATSRNRASGIVLARDRFPLEAKTPDGKSAPRGEGILSLAPLAGLLQSEIRRFPLLSALADIVLKDLEPTETFRKIFPRK